MRASDLGVNKPLDQTPAVDPNEVLRPTTFDQIVGQNEAVAQLQLLCAAAIQRGETSPHVLIDGPPGLGKTTMAGAVASAMGGRLWCVTGQSIGLEQLGKRLSTQPSGAVVFVDEIQTMSRGAETMMLGAMEDFTVDMTTPMGPEHRPVKPFTLIGATTDPGALSRPLKDRFGLCVQLTYYSLPDMVKIMVRSARTMGLSATDEALTDVAERSHGTPRIANAYLARIRDYVQVNNTLGAQDIRANDVMKAFEFFDVDTLGLQPRDREYIKILYSTFRGGPAGGEQLAVRLGMDYRTISKDLEPLLMRLGLIGRAPRGRQLTDDGRRYARELLGEPE